MKVGAEDKNILFFSHNILGLLHNAHIFIKQTQRYHYIIQ